MSETKAINMYNNDIIFWKKDHATYALVARQDTEPKSPRETKQNFAHLYFLKNNKHKLKSEETKKGTDFWLHNFLMSMLYDDVPYSIKREVEDLHGFHDSSLLRRFEELTGNYLYNGLVWLQETCNSPIVSLSLEPIDQWTSTCVGVISMDRPTAEALAAADKNKKWYEAAEECVKTELDMYNSYLRGAVYEYSLHMYTDKHKPIPGLNTEAKAWREMEECPNFYGSDILSNGVTFVFDYGLLDALKYGNYRTGSVEEIHTITYQYHMN